MSDNFFDDNDEFRDNPVDTQDGQWVADQGNVRAAPVSSSQKKAIQAAVQKAEAPIQEIEEEVYEELESEIAEFEEEQEDYSAVLSDARLRLEQGRLYERVINNDLFDTNAGDPVAIRHVQNQIRKFAKEQMEIMLGMRKETSIVERLEIDFPFNAAEVAALKDIVLKLTKGESAHSDNYVPEVKKVTSEVDHVRSTSLNKIGSNGTSKRLPQKPKAPIARQKPAQQSALKPKQEEYKPLPKSPYEMSPEELLEYNRAAEARQVGRRTVKSPDALPQPSYEQSQMLAQNFASSVSSSSGLNARLAELVLNSKK